MFSEQVCNFPCHSLGFRDRWERLAFLVSGFVDPLVTCTPLALGPGSRPAFLVSAFVDPLVTCTPLALGPGSPVAVAAALFPMLVV